MHLWCNFYVSRPLFDEPLLNGLQATINECLPQWSVELRAAENEDSRIWKTVGRTGRLHDAIHKVAPPKRGLASATLKGAYSSVSFFLSYCETTLTPDLNKIAIEVYKRSTVEDRGVSAWARDIFEAIAQRLPIRYGNAQLNEEYSAKNMILGEGSARAIGANINRAIPGLYWLNYLGAPYVELIGRERLLSTPAYEVKAVADGVLLGLDASAESWQSPEYQQREQHAIAHLGEKYFFSRHDPGRETVAPDFYALHKKAKATGP